MIDRIRPETAQQIREGLALYAIKMSLEKLVRRAERAGISIVVDSDAVAIRLIPRKEVRAADDLRKLGTTVRVHDACGGGASAIGADPITHTR